MAKPIIRSVSLSKTTIAPGESVELTVVADDPDNRTVSALVRASDAAGNVSTSRTTLTIGDPVSVVIEVDDQTVTVVADPNDPTRFVLTAGEVPDAPAAA